MSARKAKGFIDTNIFLYAHDSNDRKKQQIARALIFNEFKHGNCAISTQVMAEFFQNFVVKFKKPYVDAIKELHFMSQCLIMEQSLRLLVTATRLHDSHSLSFWDAMIVAAASEACATVLYSEDLNAGQVIEGVRIVNPFN